MHKVEIPDHIVARVLRRQGRWNVHDDVPPRQTAFVVVDMQNYFMAPGQQVEIPAAREIVPNVNRLADALRRAGGLVVWIRTVSNEDSLKNWSHFHDVLNTPERKARRMEALRDGAFGAELWPGLDRAQGRSDRLQDALQRLHPGVVGPGGAIACARHHRGLDRQAPRPTPAVNAQHATPCC